MRKESCFCPGGKEWAMERRQLWEMGGGVSALLGNTGVSQMKTDKVQLLLHQSDSKGETELSF